MDRFSFGPRDLQDDIAVRRGRSHACLDDDQRDDGTRIIRPIGRRASRAILSKNSAQLPWKYVVEAVLAVPKDVR